MQKGTYSVFKELPDYSFWAGPCGATKEYAHLAACFYQETLDDQESTFVTLDVGDYVLALGDTHPRVFVYAFYRHTKHVKGYLE